MGVYGHEGILTVPLRKFLFSLQRRRRWWLRSLPQGPLRDYYETPFPEPDSDWRSLDYLAVDFETTGLHAPTDDILSIGYVAIRGQALRLSECGHYLTRPTCPVPESSAIVHGILDDTAARATTLAQVVPLLLRALAGKVMVTHHAAIEHRFLNEACRRLYGHPFAGPVVDTLALEIRRFRARDQAVRAGDLRLSNVRRRYGLPCYRAHDALIDAIATGELFLAQVTQRPAPVHPALKRLTIAT